MKKISIFVVVANLVPTMVLAAAPAFYNAIEDSAKPSIFESVVLFFEIGGAILIATVGFWAFTVVLDIMNGKVK